MALSSSLQEPYAGLILSSYSRCTNALLISCTLKCSFAALNFDSRFGFSFGVVSDALLGVLFGMLSGMLCGVLFVVVVGVL